MEKPLCEPQHKDKRPLKDCDSIRLHKVSPFPHVTTTETGFQYDNTGFHPKELQNANSLKRTQRRQVARQKGHWRNWRRWH